MITKFFGWKRNGYRLEKENHDNLMAIGKGSQFLFLFNSQLQSLDSRDSSPSIRILQVQDILAFIVLTLFTACQVF